MRKFQMNLLMYIVASVLVLFTACKDEEKPAPVPDKLSVEPKELEFAANDDEEQFVDVTTNVKTWKASTSANWISINENEGSNDFAVTVIIQC